jgi:hypothetical protein
VRRRVGDLSLQEESRGGTPRQVLNTFYVTCLVILGSYETSKCWQYCCQEMEEEPPR